MSLEAFQRIAFRAPTLAVIERANEIIAEYFALGFVLTLRQGFYQFVSRQWIANQQSEYKRLGTIIKKARRAGLIDWDTIEDRTRNVHFLPTWTGPGDRIASCADYYHEDVWASQPYRPEVWIEKDALTGVIEGGCDELRVPWFSCRGNVSESEMYAAGKRFARQLSQGYIPIVLHLGDHDPNGLDMTRDIRERLALFARQPIEVRRIALTIEQVRQYNPPPNPAKEKDTRFAAYARQFGRNSWELDALDPTVISDLIRREIESLIDTAAWTAAMATEEENRDVLNTAAENWTMVENLLRRAP